MEKLTRKEQMFCDEYLIDFNGARAAAAAGYSVNAAKETASRLLTKNNVAAYIEQRMRERMKRTEISQDRVLQELAAIAFADATDYYISPIEGMRALKELTPNQRAAIAGIKQGAYGTDIKLVDKIKALELLGRHLGMYTDKADVRVSGSVSFAFDALDADEISG